ncbi:MAG: TnpV protein, partial [Clostridia bacterium]|nr:TnpV protein [Clostridia bacterium]
MDRLATLKFQTLFCHPNKQISSSANGVSECRWHSNRRTDRAGRRDMMHKNYLEHNKRGIFMLMVTKYTLWPYLADIDRQANEMYDLLIEQM